MPKAKTTYPEIEEIKEDLDSLKDNVVALTKHVKKESVVQAEVISDTAKERIALAKLRGQQEVKKVEKQIKAKPAQSVAIAFAGGLLASMLIRGRR